jgi:LacI family transcriptional regulator
MVAHTMDNSFLAMAAGFNDAVRTAGATLLPPPPPECFLRPGSMDARRWLESMPSPCAFLCQHDFLAAEIARIAEECGRSVPDDVAVVGVGNDPIVCMIHRPTLTSVSLPAERIGWMAAELIDHQINGREPASLLLPPDGVVQRGSTNTLSVGDPVVAKAVHYLREHFSEPVSSKDIAKHVRLSRNALRVRFAKILGLTPHDELVRCRLARAKHLLTGSDIPVRIVAAESGFPQLANFNRFIHKHTGRSPRQYRAAYGSHTRSPLIDGQTKRTR